MATHSYIRRILVAAVIAFFSPISQAQDSEKTADADDARAAFRQAIETIEKGNDLSLAMQFLSESFKKGYKHPSLALRDPAFKPFRDDPSRRAELRKLLGAHACESNVEMVAADEKGERILIELEVVDKETSKPLADTRVYLYHTDAEGDYVPEADGPGGGSENPRLFAFVRTDSDGCATIASILPGSYRGTQAPKHIHLEVDRADSRIYGTGIYFESDTAPDDELRDEAASGRISAVRLKSDESPYRAHARIQVPRG